jgi:AraC family transcriptional regulator of adaptative response/methylated-DNA-[protein]-cysteine methyltransferase
MEAYSTDQERWEALVERDRGADGAYVYGVVTTGIYCRPACSSRLPNRDNVRFFDTYKDAERAGFRPCKRCHPSSPDGRAMHHRAIVRACQLIEESEESPSLADLANAAGFSPSHFHRVFKKTVGLTPKQYATAVRSNRLRARLQTGSNVTEAVYEAGFASSSRFYENATHTLGMKPSKYRNGGHGLRIRFAVAPCYLGWVLIAATGKGVCAIDLGDDPEAMEESLRARFSKAEFVDDDPRFTAWMAQALAFLESPRDHFDLPLDIEGTAFQRRVWLALREIPPGSTASYADIAARIDNPKAARAVAQACAANDIAIAIPCHRVVRSDGGLGGYRWGRERKRKLLEREAKEVDG